MVPVSKRTIIQVCKEETYSIYIEIDAQIIKKQWPKGARDIYILF